jgi:hypothetical protein
MRDWQDGNFRLGKNYSVWNNFSICRNNSVER